MLFFCRCGRSPSTLIKREWQDGSISWVCECRKAYADDPDIALAFNVARAIESAAREQLEAILPTIVREALDAVKPDPPLP